MIILKIIFNSKLKNHEAGELNLNYTQLLLPLSSQALHYHKFLFFPNCFNISKVLGCNCISFATPSTYNPSLIRRLIFDCGTHLKSNENNHEACLFKVFIPLWSFSIFLIGTKSFGLTYFNVSFKVNVVIILY
jgi:hypothetical protein